MRKSCNRLLKAKRSYITVRNEPRGHADAFPHASAPPRRLRLTRSRPNHHRLTPLPMAVRSPTEAGPHAQDLIRP
jgi:hypothetical protein